jgi:hypothetical protein
MDYWKKVPGIDEAKDEKGFLVALNTALTELAHAAVLSDNKAISKTLISHKKAIEKEVQSAAKGLKEARNVRPVDSSYLQRSLDIIADDYKHGEKEEKRLVPIFRHIESRLNQSFPDGDVTAEDIEDLLKEVSSRSAVKKSGMSVPNLVDMIMDVQ